MSDGPGPERERAMRPVLSCSDSPPGAGAASPSEQMTVHATTAGGHQVIGAVGELDMASVPALRAAIDTAIQDGARHLVVDLQGVRFMDSTGLNLLVAVYRQLGPGSLSVVASLPSVRRVFAISGIDALIPVFDSLAAALEAASRTASE
jgi:anti-sigma B factor antagonist